MNKIRTRRLYAGGYRVTNAYYEYTDDMGIVAQGDITIGYHMDIPGKWTVDCCPNSVFDTKKDAIEAIENGYLMDVQIIWT